MNLFQHFRPEEKPFVEKALEWVNLAEDRGVPRLTDFLDPRQANILQSLVNRGTGVHVRFFGGYDGAERKRAVIAPDYIPIEEGDFSLSLVWIEKRSSFHQLEHRDYLGALLHLGIKREKFGDLLVHADGAQLILASEMLEYVSTHLHQVGRAPVLVQEIPFDRLRLPERQIQEKMVSTASMRLDALLSEILQLSRSKTLPLIQSGKVKVNWMIVDKPSYEIEAGDVISVRGYGRCTVLEIAGTSRKGNLRVRIGFETEIRR